MYEVKYPLATLAIIFLVPIFIAACGSEVNPVSIEAASTLKNVPGLRDCQAYKGMIDNRLVTIIRCPNSSTSVAYPSGKTTINSITIDNAQAITEWEESKKKVESTLNDLVNAQKEYDDSVAKLKR